MDTCGGRHLRLSFLKDMGPTPKLVQRTRLPRVEATESRYDFFNRISGKVVRSKLPKNCGSAIASDDATMTLFYGYVNGLTRELTWRLVPFDAKVRDVFDGTQVADVLPMLEFLNKSTTCSFPDRRYLRRVL